MFDRNNPMFNNLGGFTNFQTNFNNFMQNFKSQVNVSPEEKVRELLNSGAMSQEQFIQLKRTANMLTGKKF
jgi:hypothetical protein